MKKKEKDKETERQGKRELRSWGRKVLLESTDAKTPGYLSETATMKGAEYVISTFSLLGQLSGKDGKFSIFCRAKGDEGTRGPRSVKFCKSKPSNRHVKRDDEKSYQFSNW